MDTNTVLLWFAGIQALSLFSRNARAARKDWMWVSGLVLLTAGIGWLHFPDVVGYVTFALCALLLMLPRWAHLLAGRALGRSQYGRAVRLERVAALLHPFDGWRQLPRLFRAMGLAHEGKVAEAQAQLTLLAQGKSSVAAMARVHRLRILERWDELKLLAEHEGMAALSRDPLLLTMYLRALGELGQTDELADLMLSQESILFGGELAEPACLYLFAYTGHAELARQVLATSRRNYDEENRDIWLGLASMRAGNIEQAKHTFTRLSQSKNPSVRGRAERDLSILAEGIPYQPPTPRTAHIVTHFARVFADRQNLLLSRPAAGSERRVTLALVVANALIYVWSSHSLLGMATSEDFGERWAFLAPAILSGEWWRMFSYLFVHANWLHLAMNLLALWALGPFVERAFGRLRFSLIYLFSGFTGSVVYLCLYCYQIADQHTDPRYLVGASGSIMGLLGATGAVMLRAWLKQRAPMAKQILLRLLMVVALQVTFDYYTPQVAGLAHALGLFGGFLIAMLLHERVSARRSVQALP